ncbi:hypothetical protein EDB89DRAFT_2143675 [Lactarius sanguifluus]|nr:hypothetical protein EDB89DRAFT_2143675 [Lactarius sanguifluus]
MVRFGFREVLNPELNPILGLLLADLACTAKSGCISVVAVSGVHNQAHDLEPHSRGGCGGLGCGCGGWNRGGCGDTLVVQAPAERAVSYVAKAAHECGLHHPFTLAKVTAVVDGMLLTAVQAAAERAVSANAARGCGEVEEENGGLHGVPLGWVVAGGRKRSRTLPRGTKLHIGGRLYQEHVMFESLRMHTNATCWGTWVRILLNRERNHRSSSAKIAEPDPQLASGPVQFEFGPKFRTGPSHH